MNCSFIKLSNTAILDSEINIVEKIYSKYNQALPILLRKLPKNILHSFFHSEPETLTVHDIVVNNIEMDEDTVKFNISGFFHNQEKLAIGSLLFTGVKDIKAEFDDSPVTLDYLHELMQDRALLELYFDVLPNNTYSVDIYSLNEERFEDGKDDDDFQILHLQFKFTGYSADLEAVAKEPEKNEKIDAMDTFDTEE